MKQLLLSRLILSLIALWSISTLAGESVTGKLSKVTISTSTEKDLPPGVPTTLRYIFEWTYIITTAREQIAVPGCDMTVLVERPDSMLEPHEVMHCYHVGTEILASNASQGKLRVIGPVVKAGKDQGENKIVDYVLRLWCGTNLLDVVTMKTDAESKGANFPDTWMRRRANRDL